jgi:predicted enzyme related to lactoylglutathione lyase
VPHKLTGVCLISDDVRRLAEFYRSVLHFDGNIGDEYSSFETGGVVLSIFSTRGMEGMAPGSTADAGTGRWVVEFEVADVDAEYARLAGLGVGIVKRPTTQPWGLRSVWFRDPDGNIVNFFARVVG